MFVLMFAVVFEAQNYGRFLLRSFAADLNGKLHCHVLENVWGMGGGGGQCTQRFACCTFAVVLTHKTMDISFEAVLRIWVESCIAIFCEKNVLGIEGQYSRRIFF